MANYLTTDTDLGAVADAIRTKGGTSAALAFPAGFVDAIDALPTGGGSLPFNSGTITLPSATKTLTFNFDFDPAHFCIFADNASVPTNNAWKTVGFYIPVIGGDGYVNISYGPSNRGGALRQAQYISYDSTARSLTFTVTYDFAVTTYYWCAW